MVPPVHTEIHSCKFAQNKNKNKGLPILTRSFKSAQVCPRDGWTSGHARSFKNSLDVSQTLLDKLKTVDAKSTTSNFLGHTFIGNKKET